MFSFVRIIYPTDFVRTVFSRTYKMPYRKSVSMIRDNVDGFCAVSHAFKSKVTTFVHAFCDLPNMTVARKKCN